jgi:hypothetical protein
MLRWVWDLPALISGVGTLVTLATKGIISVDQAALWFFVLVVVLAVTRAFGGDAGRLARLLLRFGLPVAAVFGLAVRLSGGDRDEMIAVLAALVTLVVMAIGLYIMVSGLFRPGR